MAKRKTLRVNTQGQPCRRGAYPRAWETALYESYRSRVRERAEAIRREQSLAEAARQRSWEAAQDPLLDKLQEATATIGLLRNSLRVAKLREEALGLRIESINQRLEIAELMVERYEDAWETLIEGFEAQEVVTPNSKSEDKRLARLIESARTLHQNTLRGMDQAALEAISKAIAKLDGEREFQAQVEELTGLEFGDMLRLKGTGEGLVDTQSEVTSRTDSPAAPQKSVKSLKDIQKLIQTDQLD